ncbi:hypothetical protein HN51_063409 [Arachis hypogaea]|uniref:Bifunctional inhibitor/plant lipid transfer protein/seed storage helical domain-containing protein n=1 Tax=Arachis hypogaea TaxID=3818 RepID=A0A445AY66_ARAHY|nr:cortical cell-delineating protein-like [Arachis ipaensis]XP_025628695.1 cortical cell-delineating protein [Arachis hypogaea]QHO21019.1 Cortical cell-delineating protein [Arachis hypogaea]RYR31361.1 hypothetical protein Ahy_B01g056174 [Arachis hypogaea]
MASNKNVTPVSFFLLLLLFTTVNSTAVEPSWNSGSHHCPIDTLKLAVCAKVLIIGAGSPPQQPCCSLIAGLVDLEAALCLCTALKANILGIHLNIPLSLSIILNNCRRDTSFKCPDN